MSEIYDFMAEHGFLYQYEVRNRDNSIYQLEEGERIPGEILFTRHVFTP